ncbi:SDR family NAD(P)-dependent oxidoreductase [Metabacillus sp. B2-18]|uniref:SDR family NAD(P)-dependent oxidoreductase n=1 Tax=Metabacillus sp. B2-18 TaxID=2897333 RepID=UPI001E4AEFF1|nr:SDR family oxidoreductase [Metabacillus sp. B2-18]UGB33230.1 SDR family oxidoreductase [Metabacillus sp. B2-18]
MSYFHTSLNGKHILITGASGGIGYVTAKIVANMGASVTITGRNEEVLSQLQVELLETTNKEKIFLKVADIAEEEDRKSLVQESERQMGFISGLVNAAAIAGGETVENLKEDFLIRMMNINYISTVMLTQIVYKRMQEEASGVIVNVSSLSGLRGTYGNTAYSSSKFALIGFTQCMAVEAIKSNIRVNAVCPGFVDTSMGRDVIMRKAKQNGLSYEDQYKQIETSIPSERITQPDEVGNTIAFLLTDAARNIVGESIKISGGSVMR